MAGAELLEFDSSELDRAISHQSAAPGRAVIVRGLLSSVGVAPLAAGIERAFSAYDAPAADTDWFAPFVSKGPEMKMTRGWLRQHGGVLAVDCPPMLGLMRETYRSAGIIDGVRGALGSEAVLSSYKTTLRLTDAATRSVGWHQDGAFLGQDARVLNIWMALTDCGIEAPSLDVATARLDAVVGTGTENAAYSWSVGEARAMRESGAVVTPVLAPGDAVLFDHLCLHRTAAMKATKTRKAIEAWFFDPSTLPANYDAVML